MLAHIKATPIIKSRSVQLVVLIAVLGLLNTTFPHLFPEEKNRFVDLAVAGAILASLASFFYVITRNDKMRITDKDRGAGLLMVFPLVVVLLCVPACEKVTSLGNDLAQKRASERAMIISDSYTQAVISVHNAYLNVYSDPDATPELKAAMHADVAPKIEAAKQAAIVLGNIVESWRKAEITAGDGQELPRPATYAEAEKRAMETMAEATKAVTMVTPPAKEEPAKE